jgi:hypothetical protein
VPGLVGNFVLVDDGEYFRTGELFLTGWRLRNRISESLRGRLGQRCWRDDYIATVRHPISLGERLARRPGHVAAVGRRAHGRYPWRCSSPEEEGVLASAPPAVATAANPIPNQIISERMAAEGEGQNPITYRIFRTFGIDGFF